MTQLIYRGVEHDGATEFQARAPMPLMYRGQAHDGIAPAAPASRKALHMVYRGVEFSIGYDVTPMPRAKASAARRSAQMADVRVAEYA